jgi:acetylornithine deacetylase/succinyl-diaminopimelate desuccinylase-like protein
MPNETLIEILRELVARPSVHPLASDDASIVGEQRVAKYLGEALDTMGFDVAWDEFVPGRPNVIGRCGPDRPKHTLLLESHLDTVGVAGMKRPPFELMIDKGRAYGRGACDTKGPMAAALWALAETMPILTEAGVSVIYAGAMGEEKGNEGALRLVEQGVTADEAVVLEPTDLNVVHTHKGALWFEVKVEGVPGHGSDPDRGLSAIEGMERVMELLRRLTREAAETVPPSPMGRPTLNIGVIRGGEELNIIPGACSIQVDRRTVPGEDNAAIADSIRAGLDALQEKGCFESWTFRMIKDAHPYRTGEDAPLVKRLHEACLTEAAASRVAGAAWYSDAGPLSEVCDQTVVFGPGSIKQAHTSDEYIELEQLAAGAHILKAFFLRTAEAVRGREV